ncbi:hypothetical protein HOY82DRAFT_222750 [Tuber indicum]|nr:hypothetical protein HOY82DRAFT_222750 [Tuber indicum]
MPDGQRTGKSDNLPAYPRLPIRSLVCSLARSFARLPVRLSVCLLYYRSVGPAILPSAQLSARLTDLRLLVVRHLSPVAYYPPARSLACRIASVKEVRQHSSRSAGGSRSVAGNGSVFFWASISFVSMEVVRQRESSSWCPFFRFFTGDGDELRNRKLARAGVGQEGQARSSVKPRGKARLPFIYTPGFPLLASGM